MIRGACPTVHAPMPTGDGLLARVKPFGGRLPAPRLAALADAAARFGNGTVELTGRGNIQVRGVHDPAAFARAMVAAGLADPDPEREARRNVTALPGCDDALVAAAEAVLADTPGLAPKFGVVVRGHAIIAGDADLTGVADLRRWLAEPPSCPGPTRVATPAGDADADGGHAGVLLYLQFGQTDATSLARLANLAPEIRTTPWRAFLSPVAAPGFATRPDRIAACPGAPACASGSVPARADAAVLQAAGFAGLHVSGCAKGCAHPGATTTLTGRGGRYDLVRHGRAADPPHLTGLTLAEAMAAL